jgi:hydroxysqualene synthase
MQGVAHYENFPVASWLCPAHLRPPIVAIYHFARTADDLADEGTATPEQRLADLRAYRNELQQAFAGASLGHGSGGRWSGVFGPLARAVGTHHIPAQPMHDLLDAFEQDVRYTADGTRYPDTDALLDYCRQSANPVGRLLLHLYGVHDRASIQHSDAICSALQLINFWQDLRTDLARQRHYLPQDALLRHGVSEADLTPGRNPPGAEALVQALTDHARGLMLQGAPLVWHVPGRLGWELRLVVQGGLRVLDLIASLQHRTWQHRPRLRAWDLMPMFWRAARMSAPTH